MTHPDDYIDPDVQQALDTIQPVPPRDPTARARGQARFLSEARDLQHTKALTLWQRLVGIFGMKPQSTGSPTMAWRLSSLTLALAIGLVLLFSGSAVTAYAAQGALPGDPLYRLKNVTEGARVRLNPDPGADADLHLLFAQRRIEEIRDLIAKDRFDDITIATHAFERHILQAIGALGELAVIDPTRAAQVTDRILASLSSYTVALTDYLANVPTGPPQQALENAVQTTRARFRPSEFEFSGVISAIQVNYWIVADKTVRITLQTKIKGIFNLGDRAEVEALVAVDGSLTAREIKSAEDKIEERNELEFTGVVEQINADRWVVGGRVIFLTALTEIKDAIGLNDLVQIEGVLKEDGSVTAIEIKLVESREDSKENSIEGSDPPDENVNGNEQEDGEDSDDNSNGDDDSNDDDSNDNSGNNNDNNDDGDNDDGEDEPDEDDPSDDDLNDNEEDDDEEEQED
jgi:hypothetical protein